MKRIIFLLTLFLLIGFNCFAIKSYQLFEECTQTEKIINGGHLTNTKDAHASGRCLAYMVGYRDALEITNEIGVKTICLERFNNGQLVMMVLNYARQNPDKLSLDAGFLVFYALSKHRC